MNGRQIVYAIILEYPYDTESIELHSVTDYFDNDTKAILVGYSGYLNVRKKYFNCHLFEVHTCIIFLFKFISQQWTVSSNGAMSINLPRKSLTDKIGLDYAWTIRLDIPMQQ